MYERNSNKMPYNCDSAGCYPWYNETAVLTIEGPTDQYTFINVQVRKLK